jgi:AraC-like DNA-binding protein
MLKAREMLTETTMPISQISEKVGYQSEFSFSKAFKKNTGLTPGAVRKSAII